MFQKKSRILTVALPAAALGGVDDPEEAEVGTSTRVRFLAPNESETAHSEQLGLARPLGLVLPRETERRSESVPVNRLPGWKHRVGKESEDAVPVTWIVESDRAAIHDVASGGSTASPAVIITSAVLTGAGGLLRTRRRDNQSEAVHS